MKSARRTASLPLTALLLTAMFPWPQGARAGSRLEFNDNGQFRIVQFTDIHWHRSDADDMKSARLMGEVLDREEPDLVVLTGDIIGGGHCKDPAGELPKCLAPITQRGLTWVLVFGNHDDECRMSRDELMKLMRGIPGCLSEPGPRDITGVGNFMLPIHARRGGVAAALYFIDSNAYADTKHDNYDWIHHDQIEWYRKTAAKLHKKNKSKPVPSLAFYHIPVPEYNDAWNAPDCVGSKYETVCCPKMNSGFFTAMVEMNGMMGNFVGHDHVNDYMGTVAGIRLCYGRASGFSAYGRDGFPRGARVIELSEGADTFDTWLRLDGGNKVIQQGKHTDLDK